jgi:hypothetical protein
MSSELVAKGMLGLMVDPIAGLDKPSAIHIGWNPDSGEWDPESPVGKLLVAMRIGAYAKEACGYGGLRLNQVVGWMRVAQQALPDDPDEDPPRASYPVEVRAHVDLLFRLTTAESSAVVEAIGFWRKAMADDWRAVRDWLARRHATEWKETTGRELTGGDGGPVEVEAILIARKVAEHPVARAHASAALAEIAGSIPPDVGSDDDVGT